MPVSGHLELSSSGTLVRSFTGHLKLARQVYTAALDPDASRTYAAGQDLDDNMTNAEEVAAAVAAMQALTSSATTTDRARAGVVWFFGGGAFNDGVVFRVTANNGGSFGNPVAASISIGVSACSGCGGGYTGTLVVGTGSSAPTGQPRTWQGSVATRTFSNDGTPTDPNGASVGSFVLSNIALSNFVWVRLDISPWSMLNPSGLSYSRFVADYVTFGSILEA